MGFFVGFGDELEKLALRPPSPSEIAPTGFGFSGGGATPAPDPAAPPTQNVHVHVHPQGGGKAAPKKTKVSADIPKPQTDVSKGFSNVLVGESPTFNTNKKTNNYSKQMKTDEPPEAQSGGIVVDRPRFGLGKHQEAAPKPPPAANAPSLGTAPSFAGHGKTHDYSSQMKPAVEPDEAPSPGSILPPSQRGPTGVAKMLGKSPSFGQHVKTHDYSSQEEERGPPTSESGPIVTKQMSYVGGQIPLGVGYSKQLPGSPAIATHAPFSAGGQSFQGEQMPTHAPPTTQTGADPTANFKPLPVAPPKKKMHGVPGTQVAAAKPWKDPFTQGSFNEAPEEPARM